MGKFAEAVEAAQNSDAFEVFTASGVARKVGVVRAAFPAATDDQVDDFFDYLIADDSWPVVADAKLVELFGLMLADEEA
jgi:hypothetical protein